MQFMITVILKIKTDQTIVYQSPLLHKYSHRQFLPSFLSWDPCSSDSLNIERVDTNFCWVHFPQFTQSLKVTSSLRGVSIKPVSPATWNTQEKTKMTIQKLKTLEGRRGEKPLLLLYNLKCIQVLENSIEAVL